MNISAEEHSFLPTKSPLNHPENYEATAGIILRRAPRHLLVDSERAHRREGLELLLRERGQTIPAHMSVEGAALRMQPRRGCAIS